MNPELSRGFFWGVQTILFLSISLLAYTWIVYPALLWMLKWKLKRPIRPVSLGGPPLVSVIVAAHDEEEHIGAKLEDCLRWTYPRQLMEIIVASDGSTDSTEKIVAAYGVRDPRIRLLCVERGGKSQAQNRAVREAKGEILFFTDVNTRTRPDLLELLVRNFQDPEVGMVTATVHFVQPDGAVSNGQGLYWRYELFLREAESALGVLATGSGQALALRRPLFREMPTFYGDDCVLPLDVRLQGYRVLQDAQALVFDAMPHSIEGELRARVRMTTRNWTGTLSRFRILNPFRFPLTSCALISHKLLRWLTPFFLLAVLFCNTLLLFRSQFLLLGILQAVFYTAALVGWLRTRKARRPGLFAYPFSFCLANLGFFLGLVMVVRNEKIAAYQSGS
jgi:cellulose synthase/poly-beta-1,6-N-acetylglucosamine synthase-like glycosyltransferase